MNKMLVETLSNLATVVRKILFRFTKTQYFQLKPDFLWYNCSVQNGYLFKEEWVTFSIMYKAVVVNDFKDA